jgi:hypothetical protein
VRRGGIATLGVGVLLALAGCSGTGGDPPAYVALQNAIKSHITDKDHRPVRAVSCTPHHEYVPNGERRDLRCEVEFEDGSSYVADAVIRSGNTGGRHNQPDSYSWDAPPAP